MAGTGTVRFRLSFLSKIGLRSRTQDRRNRTKVRERRAQFCILISGSLPVPMGWCSYGYILIIIYRTINYTLHFGISEQKNCYTTGMSRMTQLWWTFVAVNPGRAEKGPQEGSFAHVHIDSAADGEAAADRAGGPCAGAGMTAAVCGGISGC